MRSVIGALLLQGSRGLSTRVDVQPRALSARTTGLNGWSAVTPAVRWEHGSGAWRFSRDAALDWSGRTRSARPARWTSLFGVDVWTANETKKARSVVALSRVPR